MHYGMGALPVHQSEYGLQSSGALVPWRDSMATTRKPTGADNQEYSAPRGERPSGAKATDCTICQAPLPDGNQYLCTPCAADSAARAQAILDRLYAGQVDSAEEAPLADAPDTVDDEELMACPTCGMALDDSGRCAGCVTTVRR